ncbi:dihydrolipoyllysine-residue acetyltransferase [Piscinibacter koreensis]|uniref:Acetyltransferase component of pyruvate dehydrogenase complex n=1 Tax=Piscinibacter koreensis TaxID=2742824 RepID=A0A7Y6TVL6_9BURK|nr:dihydrolipoyllysine-residue acetyltransferase [Schlegelella koreensis]NUZ05061.1 dihydrolipoyllysine-residue acetyltransferase [Schlegelella koreensis]
MALVEVKVPDIGDFSDVEIIELLVKPGDTIAADQSLITVESDKASMEIPSSAGGVVKELKVKLGDKVSEGSPLLVLESADAGQAASAPAPAASAPAPAPGPAPAASAPPLAAQGGGAPVEVVVPDIGDFAEVAVIEVMVKPGDTIKPEQSLITVESDKASMEIPSSHGGVVKEVRVKVGDKVSEGSPVVVLEGGAAGATSAAASAPAPAAAPSAAAAPAPSPAPSGPAERTLPTAALPAHEPSAPRGALPHASPTIRKLARELGVPLDEVKGSGPKGRITQQDVQAFVKGVMEGSQQTKAQAAKAPAAASAGGAGFPGLLAWPQVDFAKFGPVERKDLPRIKKISGANLHRNWVMIPHVTNHDDADITELEAFRVLTNKENEKNKDAPKVTMLAFLIKASVAALKQFPEFNASLEGDQLVYKKYFHIGFAADTPNGLMVPVIKDCDQKGVLQISKEMGELAKKAREGKLSPGEMTGGCFSISSLGGIGGRYFTPIINAPEVAILGVCRSTTEPRWDGKAFQPRLILPLSLSWDHRVIDGAAAARFNAFLVQILGDFRRVLL